MIICDCGFLVDKENEVSTKAINHADESAIWYLFRCPVCGKQYEVYKT